MTIARLFMAFIISHNADFEARSCLLSISYARISELLGFELPILARFPLQTPELCSVSASHPRGFAADEGNTKQY
jgi:hypothetical protein